MDHLTSYFYPGIFSLPGPESMLFIVTGSFIVLKNKEISQFSLKFPSASVQFPAGWLLLPAFICKKLYSTKGSALKAWHDFAWQQNSGQQLARAVKGETCKCFQWDQSLLQISFTTHASSHQVWQEQILTCFGENHLQLRNRLLSQNYVTKWDPSHQIIASSGWSFLEMRVRPVKKWTERGEKIDLPCQAIRKSYLNI